MWVFVGYTIYGIVFDNKTPFWILAMNSGSKAAAPATSMQEAKVFTCFYLSMDNNSH